jgi:hypothetical protein
LKVDPNTGKRLANGWLWNPTTGKPQQVLAMETSAMQQQASPSKYDVPGSAINTQGEERWEPPIVEGPGFAPPATAEGLESYQPTFRDIGHQQQTAVPQWQQEMMFPDQGPQQNLVAEMGYIPSQTPDYTGRDARFLGADMDVIPPGQTPNMVGMDPREMQANAPEIRQDASGNYVEIANPYGQGSSQPPGFTSNRPDLVPDTPVEGTGGVLPPNYVEPTEQPVPTMDPVHGDHFDDTGEVEVPTTPDDVIDPIPETDINGGGDQTGTGQQQAAEPYVQQGPDYAVPTAHTPGTQQAPQYGPVVQQGGQLPPPTKGGGIPLPKQTLPGELPTLETPPPPPPTKPGDISTVTGKAIQDNITSLDQSNNPLDVTLKNTLTEVLEQGADIDSKSLIPKLKNEREKLSGIRETAQRRLLADLARRGFQLGGDQEAAVLAELEREVTTATAQAFRNIVNEERTRADQRLAAGMNAAGQFLGREAETGLSQQQLAQNLRLGLGQERLGLGREEQARQELAEQTQANRRQQEIQRYQAGTQQYQAETQRITSENEVLLRNLELSDRFQQFLMQMGFDKARYEATLQQAQEGQTADLMKLLVDYQNTVNLGGAQASN